MNTYMTTSYSFALEYCFYFYELLSWKRYYYGANSLTTHLKLPFPRSLPSIDEWSPTSSFIGVNDQAFWVDYEADFRVFSDKECQLVSREASIHLEMHGAPDFSNFDDALDSGEFGFDCHDDADLEVNLETNVPLHFRQQVIPIPYPNQPLICNHPLIIL